MPDPERPVGAASLNGCRVLVARPAHQASMLCRMIESAGGQAQSLPLLDIVPVANPQAAAARLAQHLDARLWIFSSSNAVEYAAAMMPRPWPPTAAVGASTARALAAVGISDVLVPPAGDGAAALLDHAALQTVTAQAIVLVSGEQPLPELETRLRQRGADITAIAVYRRVPVPHSPDVLAQAIAETDVAIVPSGEALMQLVRLTPGTARAALLDLQLALPSLRVVEKARELGFRRPPLLPERVSDAAYVDALRCHVNPGEQDRPIDHS
jgi:uroporphyrinogen-III synthase